MGLFDEEEVKKRREKSDKAIADKKASQQADRIARLKGEVEILYDRGVQARRHPFDFQGFDDVRDDWLAEWSDKRDEYNDRQADLRRAGYHGPESTKEFVYPKASDKVNPGDLVPPNGDWRVALKAAKAEAKAMQPDAIRAMELEQRNEALDMANRSLTRQKAYDD
jgi:hypothetical protein